MFSLIITIVSIALVVALVAATMYHGGDTLTQGRVTADAAAFVSGAQQVGGAATMYLSLEGSAPADVAALVTKSYLASAPVVKGTALTLGTESINSKTVNTVESTVDSAAVCQQINKAAGITATATADAGDTDTALVVVANDLGTVAYGCLSGTKQFTFKY